MDPNTRFAQIEQIMQAKKALAKQLEPSEKVDGYVFEDMCLEWSIFRPSCRYWKGGGRWGNLIGWWPDREVGVRA